MAGSGARTVIHFARFEQLWLRDLHRRYGDGAYPFDIVCLHEIARRILPDLPRRGLRPLAGYFGFPVTLLRRSEGHVRASVFAWKHLIAALAERGVDDWNSLKAWLDETTAPKRRRTFPMAREARLALPDAPGVYRMLRTGGDVLYIGKAISLKRRVNSYFQKRSGVGERMLEMLSQARELDATETGSALEAALLECDEIKAHAPPYNVALRHEREVCFVDIEAATAAARPGPGHRVGPLPSRRSLGPLFRVAGLCGHEPNVGRAEALAALGIPAAHRFEARSFREGMACFRGHFGERERVSPRRLLRLGSELHKRMLDDDALATIEAPDDDDAPWDPARVRFELERVTLTAAQQIRRARWLCLLSESSVAWRPGATARSARRLLVIERGAIVERRTLAEGERLPVPVGASLTLRERQQSFDVASYDRLRVLSTELKRVVGANPAAAAVRVSARPAVFGDRLWRLLRMV
jgi:DNA polymerase-3 subunit epsilon